MAQGRAWGSDGLGPGARGPGPAPEDARGSRGGMGGDMDGYGGIPIYPHGSPTGRIREIPGVRPLVRLWLSHGAISYIGGDFSTNFSIADGIVWAKSPFCVKRPGLRGVCKPCLGFARAASRFSPSLTIAMWVSRMDLVDLCSARLFNPIQVQQALVDDIRQRDYVKLGIVESMYVGPFVDFLSCRTKDLVDSVRDLFGRSHHTERNAALQWYYNCKVKPLLRARIPTGEADEKFAALTCVFSDELEKGKVSQDHSGRDLRDSTRPTTLPPASSRRTHPDPARPIQPYPALPPPPDIPRYPPISPDIPRYPPVHPRPRSTPPGPSRHLPHPGSSRCVIVYVPTSARTS